MQRLHTNNFSNVKTRVSENDDLKIARDCRGNFSRERAKAAQHKKLYIYFANLL